MVKNGSFNDRGKNAAWKDTWHLIRFRQSVSELRGFHSQGICLKPLIGLSHLKIKKSFDWRAMFVRLIRETRSNTIPEVMFGYDFGFSWEAEEANGGRNSLDISVKGKGNSDWKSKQDATKPLLEMCAAETDDHSSICIGA